MSFTLFIGTFLISVHLKDFKNALFFPTKVRCFISDFAVIIAIMSMTLLDMYAGVNTPKLEVPREFKPTLNTRGWVISPFAGNHWLSIPAAALPAMLGTILIFMDQQITAVIVNRKENKLKVSFFSSFECRKLSCKRIRDAERNYYVLNEPKFLTLQITYLGLHYLFTCLIKF